MTTALATTFDVGTEIARVSEHVNAIQHLIDKHMKEGLHYAIIAPGEKRGGKKSADGGLDNRPKPSLLKPGAELLCMMFKLSPEYDYTVNPLAGGHREYVFTCTIRHGGQVVGQGVGSCSSQEVKYRYRGGWEKTDKPIPREYQQLKQNGDWKKISQLLGGSEYAVKMIDGQWCVARKGDKVENPDIADVFNTVLKMAKKRAMVDAILTATAASSVFTQDLAEDLDQLDELPEPDDLPGETTPNGAATKPPASPTSVNVKSPPATEADKAGAIDAFSAKGVPMDELIRLTGKPVGEWTVADIAMIRAEYKRRGFAAKPIPSTATPVTDTTTNAAPVATAAPRDPLAELRKTVQAAINALPLETAQTAMKGVGVLDIHKADETKLNVLLAMLRNLAESQKPAPAGSEDAPDQEPWS